MDRSLRRVVLANGCLPTLPRLGQFLLAVVLWMLAVPLAQAQEACLDDSFNFSSGNGGPSVLGGENGLNVQQTLSATSYGSNHGNGQVSVAPAKTYTLNQTITFEEGFSWGGDSEGGKVGFGLYGGTAPSGGAVSADGWSARLMWRGNGDGTASLVVYSYAYDRPVVPGNWGEDLILKPHTIPVGQPMNVTMEVTVNDPGQSNGSIRVWIDGELMLEEGGIMWQKNGTPSVDEIQYSTFHGGNDSSFSPQNTSQVSFSNVCWTPGALTELPEAASPAEESEPVEPIEADIPATTEEPEVSESQATPEEDENTYPEAEEQDTYDAPTADGLDSSGPLNTAAIAVPAALSTPGQNPSFDVAGRCNPFLGGWECDFKKEDTHLWWNQPAMKFITEENTDTLVSDAWSAVHQYYSTTKTLGDDAIRPKIAEMRNSVDNAIASATADLAVTAINDPRSLKPTYVDTVCNAYWGLVADRTCKSTPKLVMDLERLFELGEVRTAIAEIELNPNLYLGEEWGDIGQDIQDIKAQFNRAETIGRNLTPEAIGTEVGRRFEGMAEVLTQPKTTQAEWITSRREVSKTLHSTVADTLASANERANQAAEDRSESDRLAQFSRNSVGRMQQAELSNMNKTQSNQQWLKMREILIERGHLIGLDMAAQMQEDSVYEAEGERTHEPIPTAGPVIGNEVGARLP